MNPLLPLLGLGAAGFLLLSSKKAGASTPAGTVTTPTGVPSIPVSPQGTITTPESGPRYYTVQKGDYPGLIAQKITGESGRWQELVRANPQKPTWTAGEIYAAKSADAWNQSMQAGNFKTLYSGEKLILPESW